MANEAYMQANWPEIMSIKTTRDNEMQQLMNQNANQSMQPTPDVDTAEYTEPAVLPAVITPRLLGPNDVPTDPNFIVKPANPE